jgi:hypothetical protein
MRMSSVTVFVDDAVRGTLPGVCAKEGVATSSGMTIHSELGDRAGMGVAWLLLLAGPIGWFALLLISMSRGGRREVLTVQVPLSEPPYQRLRTARRMHNVWIGVTVVSVVAVLVSLVTVADPSLLGRAGFFLAAGLAITGVIGLIANESSLRRARIVVDLDASRRWVTLSDVHPAFIAACQAQEQRQGQRT